jgi:putative DeoR family transcriptional regulator (stage III sporulation protein D)
MYIHSKNERCVTIGKFLVKNRSTVRGAANVFGVSKSTVHKDVTDTLKKVDIDLYLQVKEILEINKKERHLRGGEATRIKYANIEQKL